MTGGSTGAAVPEFPGLHILDHPLILHKLTHLRDRRTPKALFQRLLHEISLLMGYEITRHLPLTSEPIETPLVSMDAPVIAGKKIVVVSVLRAGLGMASGLMELMPSAREGHIGLRRDPHTLRPIEYLVSLPEADGRLFILVDPMLATGNSLAHAVAVLNRHGVPDRMIRVMALVVAPEGMRRFQSDFPDVPVYAAALDASLDANAYILPGLGDAGDRMFGTKDTH